MLWSIKNKPSYTIVNYYGLMKFVYYDGPRTAINAILAIIADSGRTIVVIYTEGEEINYFLLYSIDSDKTHRRQPRPTPWEEAPEGRVCSSIRTIAQEGETAPSWWGCLCSCV
jgi:hypothetical protein